jgi:hypothetical protein
MIYIVWSICRGFFFCTFDLIFNVMAEIVVAHIKGKNTRTVIATPDPVYF